MTNLNLYQLNSIHYAPKDSEEAINCFIFAPSEDALFQFICLNGSDFGVYVDWNDTEELEEGEEPSNYYIGDDYDTVVTKQQLIMHLKGDNDEDVREFCDLYYGQTRYEWKLLKENVTTEQIGTIQALGIKMFIAS